MSELQHPEARSFEDVAELYERVRPEYPNEALTWLIERLGLGPESTVLDLGAGTGTLAIMAKQRQPLAEVTGLDADPEILEIARRKAREAAVEIAFDEGLSTDLPYDDATFDRVLSTLFFHHLTRAEKETTLTEIHRVLRPDGELHIADYTRAADPLQAALTLPVRVFDGFSRTRDNYAGRLPELIAAAGFTDVLERRRVRTGFGTIGLLSALRAS